MESSEKKLAVLVGIAERGTDVPECERSLDELARLADTAGAAVFSKVLQIKSEYDPRTCIGSGKVGEIRELCENNGVELVIFDIELTPAQIRNLEEDIAVAEVIDRSMLILDIFALHAVSGEGKLQVELAQLKYTAPRLSGKGKSLSRQGGGIGSRGPGESKLETDRRHLRERISILESRLSELEHNRATMRAQRDRSGIKKIAIVGYTNAGKSTLLNALTDAGVLSEDKLFATLDPTTRKAELPGGESVLFTDTVGFIRRLPHHLVKAFKSTLDEVRLADILLIVSDVTDAETPEHLKVTEDIIEELGANDKPKIYVYNKCDMLDGTNGGERGEHSVMISARTGAGISDMLDIIEKTLSADKRECRLIIPYDEQGRVSYLHNTYNVLAVEYMDSGVQIDVVLDSKGRGLLEKYII